MCQHVYLITFQTYTGKKIQFQLYVCLNPHTFPKCTVMFVPHTPGDVLTQRLQEAEDKFVENRPGGKVKMVARGGIAIK